MISTQQTSFLIYGTGGDGIYTLRILSDAGVCVTGFIDQRAREIGVFRELPVYTPHDAARFAQQDVVVVITIKNVFAHEEVAGTLQELGFRTIIFKPLAALKGAGTESEQRLNSLHDMLVVQRRWIGDGVFIPHAPPPFQRNFEDKLVVSKDSEVTTAWFPAELVFNYADPNTAFAECNMPLFFPLVGLYHGLLADGRAPEGWRDDFLAYSSRWLAKNQLSMTQGREQSLLASRVEVFQEMNRLFEVDTPFFTRHAAKATMSARGRFSVTSSGRNRIAFLIAKGFRFIPLAVPTQDYHEWNAPAHTGPLMDLLRARPFLRPLAPVPHPAFADIPTEFTEYTRLFPLRIAADLFRSVYTQHCAISQNGLRIFDDAAAARAIRATGMHCLLQDGGTAARYCASLGFSVKRVLDPAWQDEPALTQCIDKLFAPSVGPTDLRREILLLDSSASLEAASPLIEDAWRVYFLQRNAAEPPPSLQKNFRETRILFDTLCRGGRIAGKEFIRLGHA